MSFQRTNWFVGLDNTQDLRNLVNDTGNDGYLKFTDNNYETICQVAKINYNELTNKPALFSGSWNNLSDKPTLFSGSWNNLSDKPTLFSGDYNSLSNKLSAGANIRISTTNFISTGTPSQWTTTTPNIHYTAGNVGINTTNPLEKLEVNGNITVTEGADFKFKNSTLYRSLNDNKARLLLSTSNLTTGGTIFCGYGNFPFQWKIGGTSSEMYMSSSGELVAPGNITTINGTVSGNNINTNNMYKVNGTQIAVANISGLQTALDAKQNTLTVEYTTSNVCSAIIDSCNFLTDFTIPAEYATSNATSAIINSCNFLTTFVIPAEYATSNACSAIIDTCNFLSTFAIPAEYATSNAVRGIINSCNFSTFNGNYNSLSNKLTAGTNITITNNAISTSYTNGINITGNITYSGELLKSDGTNVIISVLEGVDAIANDLTTLEGIVGGKQNTLTAGTNITVSGTTISVSGGGGPWIDKGTQLSLTGGDLYYNTANVGIGTSAPAQKLEVIGSTQLLGRVINNSTDGGTSRGIMMWNSGDTNWGIYMAHPGAGRSFSGGIACNGVNLTQYAIRFRATNTATQGFIFENNAEQQLLSIRGSDGETYIRGNLQISNQLQLTGTSPTITLRDTDNRTGYFYVNSNLMYFLGGATNAAYSAWTQVTNSRWPLTLNLINNNAEFGGNVNCMSITCEGFLSVKFGVWHLSTDAKERLHYGANATTYYRGHGTTPHQWRSGTDTDLMFLRDSGKLEVQTIGSRTGNLGLQSSPVIGDQIQLNTNEFNYQSTNSASWSISSEERIKQDIVEANYETCYKNISNLPLKRYRYKDGVNCIHSKDMHRLGFIAQEVQTIFPKNVEVKPVCLCDINGVVIQEIADCLSIDTEQINMSLYGAFRHSQKKIEALEKELAMIKAHLNL